MFGNRAEKVLWFLVPHGRRAKPPAMRARSYADVVLVAPVGQVVAAFLAGAGMVAGLVGGQAGSGGQLPGQGKEVGRLVVVERGELAFADERGEAGAGLDGELVEREVAGSEA